MAKDKKSSKKPPLLTDRSNFWTDLSYIQPDLKGELWCSMAIYFAKKNARRFLDPKRAREYRATDLLEIDKREMDQMFDPITPEGGGGDAKYVTADRKANPVYIHLLNNMRADIQRMGKQIEA